MTDFRVTPQALDAAAEAIYKRDYEPLSGGVQTEWQANHCRNLARTALAAAAPLLCQPLQDENDRLRKALNELRAMHYEDGKVDCVGPVCSYCDAPWSSGVGAVPRGCLTVQIVDEALAASPVGTGWPEPKQCTGSCAGMDCPHPRSCGFPVGTGNPTQARADG